MKKLLTMTLCFVAAINTNAQRPNDRFAPMEEPFVHDPVMAYEDGKYYLFATGRGIANYISDDGEKWSFNPNPVLKEIPKWTTDSVPGFKEHIWAPDIIRWHNKWWMAYSCSTFGKNTSAIGLISADHLDSQASWKDEGMIINSKGKATNYNAIDPNFIIDNEDSPWMVFGSFWDGIQLIKLDSTMHAVQGYKPRTIARRYARNATTTVPNPTSKYAGPNAIEAPFIMKHKDYYYLFVSFDYCCRGMKSDYKVAVGRSKNIEGPYLDKDKKDMAEGGGTILIEGDKKKYEAVGHCAAYHINDKDIFISHGYNIQRNGQATLVKREIKWTKKDWPVL